MKSLASIFAGLLLCCCGCDRGIKHGVEVVLAIGTNDVARVSATELEQTARTIAGRIDKLGYRSEVKVMESNRLSVKLPFAAVESVGRQRKLFSRTGLLEFRLVHPESERLVADGMVPVGYRLMPQTRLIPGGAKQVVPIVVGRQNLSGFSGTNIRRASVIRGNLNDPQVAFEFDDAGRAALAKVTSENVGRQLAIVMDGEVYSAPMIREPILEGRGTIGGGNMTKDEVYELAVLLQFPLGMPVRVVQENTF